jgi:hypothetical protein
MNIKIENLTVSDFPGIDEAKFNEWKALKIKRNREQRIVFSIGVGILLILSVLTAKSIFLLIYLSLFLSLFIIDDVYIIYRIRYKHLRQLGKELKMSARLRAKKKGKEFTG